MGIVKISTVVKYYNPNELNDNLDTVIVVSVTSALKNWPFRHTIQIGNTASTGLEPLCTISKQRTQKPIATLSKIDQEGELAILNVIFSK